MLDEIEHVRALRVARDSDALDCGELLTRHRVNEISCSSIFTRTKITARNCLKTG
jgi:hypothetical protein